MVAERPAGNEGAAAQPRPRPGCAGLPGGVGLVGGILGNLANVESAVLRVLLLPALGRQAHEVRIARPATPGSGGVQPVAAYQAGPRVGQMLQELDQELQSGEQFHVCLEIRIVLRAVQDACFLFIHEHLAEGDRRAGDVLGEGLAGPGRGGGNPHRQVDGVFAVLVLCARRVRGRWGARRASCRASGPGSWPRGLRGAAGAGAAGQLLPARRRTRTLPRWTTVNACSKRGAYRRNASKALEALSCWGSPDKRKRTTPSVPAPLRNTSSPKSLSPVSRTDLLACACFNTSESAMPGQSSAT